MVKATPQGQWDGSVYRRLPTIPDAQGIPECLHACLCRVKPNSAIWEWLVNQEDAPYILAGSMAIFCGDDTVCLVVSASYITAVQLQVQTVALAGHCMVCLNLL